MFETLLLRFSLYYARRVFASKNQVSYVASLFLGGGRGNLVSNGSHMQVFGQWEEAGVATQTQGEPAKLTSCANTVGEINQHLQ